MTDAAPATAGLRYTAWTVAAVGVGVAGYVGYVLYPRFDLPRLDLR